MTHPKQTPLVSVVILNWNRYQDTVECLKHVRRLTYRHIEIIVVDNGSIDDSKPKLAKEPGIVFIDNPTNRGFTGGHIDGLAASSGEYVLLLNNDALISPEYVTDGLKHFQDKSVAVVGGRAYQWDESLPPFNTENPFYGYQTINPYSAEGLFVTSDNGHVLEVNNVSGSAVLVRRSAIDAVGYLYEPFFAYFEETDLFARMKRASYKVLYDPSLHIWHKGGASSSSHFQFYQLFRNRFIFAVRNFQSGYFSRFLYIYTRIGLSSIARQWQKGDQQVMRRAYAKAFFDAWLSFPKHMYERRTLSRQLGPSHYNEQLQTEDRGISFVIDLDAVASAERTAIVQGWVAALELHPRHEVVFVTAEVRVQHAAQRLIHDDLLAKVVLDRKQFTNHSLNLAWLSSKYPWIYLSDDAHVPDISHVEQGLRTAARRGASLLQYTDQDVSTQTAIYSRPFLVRTGGFQASLSIATAKQFLFAYASQAKLIISTVSARTLGIATAPLPEATITEAVRQAIELDNYTLRTSGFLGKLLARHRHLTQLLLLTRWFLTPKISLRLKAARLRNLLLFSAKFQRKAIATELKHIKNESSKVHTLDKYQFTINETTAQSLQHYQSHPNDIPVFIICRDRISTLSQQLKRLEYFGLTNISFIDNDSALPPLLEYYKKTPYQIFRTGQNVGHKSPWESGFIKTLAPESFYIVTDPDVIPVEDCPKDAMSYMLHVHGAYESHKKVGFGLKIDDLPDHYMHKQAVITWESQFWLNPLEPDVYEVPLDTTFALYKPYTYQYFLFPSIRTGGRYVARHLPWYVDNARIDPEEQYYRTRASGAVTSWTVETLGDTFQKELAKQPQTDAEEVA